MSIIIFLTISLLRLIILIKTKFYKIIFKNCIFIIIIIIIIIFNKINNYYKIFYYLGIDSISLRLIILTIWILRICLLTRNNELKVYYNNFFLLIIIRLIIILIISFFSINLIIFFIFFELRLIPIIILILGWGIQINRIQATIYIIFYTLFGSLPLLIIIIIIYNKINTLILNILNLFNISNNIINIFYYIILIRAFLIKIPIYIVHLWLPKAHVEAPIRGSIILAGIILKLGRYGIFRLILIFPKLFIKFNIIFIIIRIIGRIYRRLICLIQRDIKIIVAYSSVVHIRILIARIITITQIRFYRRIIIIIAHGLCSSSIFCLVNINYERTHSRRLIINKGILITIPRITLWWFLLSTSNFSAPPSLNLFREVILLNRLILWNKIIIPILFIILLISTSYSIYLFAFSQYGKLFKNIYNFKIISIQDKLILILHWLPLNIIFIQLNFII